MLLSLLAGASVMLADPSPAQPVPPGQQRDSAMASAARYVPAPVPLFVAIRELGEADAALRRVRAVNVLGWLVGDVAADRSGFRLRDIVATVLGLDPSEQGDELGNVGVALAAPGRVDGGGVVWLLSTGETELLTRWFPADQRVQFGVAGDARFFRMQSGLMVGVGEETVAISRDWGPGSLFDNVLALMGTGGGGGLANTSVFRDLAAYLPENPLALAYVAGDNAAALSSTDDSLLRPALTRLMLAVYDRTDRLDVAIRGVRVAEHESLSVSRAAVDRFLRLPQTTLMGAVTTLDLARAYEEAASGDGGFGGALERLLPLVSALAGPFDDEKAGPGFTVGPHLIVAWGQDLRPGLSTPQMAVLLEAGDGAVLRERVRQIAERFVAIIRGLEPTEAGERLALKETRHLGVPILHIPFASFAEKANLPPARLLRHLEPACAIWQGWVIVGLTRDHVERILDAQFGLLPTLHAVPEAREVRRLAADRAVIGIVQTAQATAVLDVWLAAQERGEPSLLSPSWWKDVSGGRRGRRLGIGMQTDPEPGAVIVARVYEGTVADGRLEPGDRVIGVNGELFSMDDPNGDMRRWWSARSGTEAARLRVLREGRLVEVELPDSGVGGAGLDPSQAIRELALLGKGLEFVSFAVGATREDAYTALVSLRFAGEGE